MDIESGMQGQEGDFRHPVILGILNITEDSFSDGGRFLPPEAALVQARKLAKDGAAVIDIGAAASNPKAKPVTPADEITRLAPVMKALRKDGIAISIDSFSTEVQRWALTQGVDYLNDIHGFAEPELYPALAKSNVKLIVMHAVQATGRATSVDIPPEGIFARVLNFFRGRIAALEQAGVERSRLILDPGMGMFLSTRPQASFEVLRRLPDLKQAFDLPVLISVSRKSFLRQQVKRCVADAGAATLAGELFAVSQGAGYIRTHDPAALADGLAVWTAALTGNTSSS